MAICIDGILSHQGVVVKTDIIVKRDDQDYYFYDKIAVVWNPETKSAFIVTYGSGGDPHPGCKNTATVDASVEILAEYVAWEKVQNEAAERRAAEARRLQAERDRALAEKAKQERHDFLNKLQDKHDATPSKGVRVVVINNRSKKAKKGEMGTVFWKGVSSFDETKIVVGIEMDNGKRIYLNADAVAEANAAATAPAPTPAPAPAPAPAKNARPLPAADAGAMQKTVTLQQVLDAAKAVYRENEGYDGEPVEPVRFAEEVVRFLAKFGSAEAFYSRYPELCGP